MSISTCIQAYLAAQRQSPKAMGSSSDQIGTLQSIISPDQTVLRWIVSSSCKIGRRWLHDTFELWRDIHATQHLIHNHTACWLQIPINVSGLERSTSKLWTLNSQVSLIRICIRQGGTLHLTPLQHELQYFRGATTGKRTDLQEDLAIRGDSRIDLDLTGMTGEAEFKDYHCCSLSHVTNWQLLPILRTMTSGYNGKAT